MENNSKIFYYICSINEVQVDNFQKKKNQFIVFTTQMEARYNFKNKLKTHVNSSSSHILEIKIRNSDLPSILLFPPHFSKRTDQEFLKEIKFITIL